MSKRVIIVENCKECPDSTLGFLMGHKRVCARMFAEECVCPDDGTPDWCPLPAVPEHKFGVASWLIRQAQVTDEDVDFWRGYIRGWNEYLKAITGEEDHADEGK